MLSTLASATRDLDTNFNVRISFICFVQVSSQVNYTLCNAYSRAYPLPGTAGPIVSRSAIASRAKLNRVPKSSSDSSASSSKKSARRVTISLTHLQRDWRSRLAANAFLALRIDRRSGEFVHPETITTSNRVRLSELCSLARSLAACVRVGARCSSYSAHRYCTTSCVCVCVPFGEPLCL